MSTPNVAPSRLEAPGGLRFVVFTIVLLLAIDIASSIFGLGWKAIAAALALILALDFAWIARSRDRALAGWLLFGLVAGFAELVADWWLVGTGTLIYPQGEPMIWASPAYMPAAWAVVLSQIGYISGWLRSRFPPVKAAIATALFAGVNIPVYEHLANGARWWHYVETPMFFDAPYYVIVAEFLLALPLAFWAKRIVGSYRGAIALGIVEGAVMWVAVVVGFTLVGPCTGALLQLSCR